MQLRCTIIVVGIVKTCASRMFSQYLQQKASAAGASKRLSCLLTTLLELQALALDHSADMLNKLDQWLRAEIFVCTQANGDGFGGCLFVANDEHIRNFLQLGVAHLGVHPLAACVNV